MAAAASQFPLPGILRQSAEGQLAFAKELLRDAEADLRRLLEGKPRSQVFKADTDPVQLVVQFAQQVELCRICLKLDDEARGVEGVWDED